VDEGPLGDLAVCAQLLSVQVGDALQDLLAVALDGPELDGVLCAELLERARGHELSDKHHLLLCCAGPAAIVGQQVGVGQSLEQLHLIHDAHHVLLVVAARVHLIPRHQVAIVHVLATKHQLEGALANPATAAATATASRQAGRQAGRRERRVRSSGARACTWRARPPSLPTYMEENLIKLPAGLFSFTSPYTPASLGPDAGAAMAGQGEQRVCRGAQATDTFLIFSIHKIFSLKHLGLSVPTLRPLYPYATPLHQP
jgi:hypothetical protein